MLYSQHSLKYTQYRIYHYLDKCYSILYLYLNIVQYFSWMGPNIYYIFIFQINIFKYYIMFKCQTKSERILELLSES